VIDRDTEVKRERTYAEKLILHHLEQQKLAIEQAKLNPLPSSDGNKHDSKNLKQGTDYVESNINLMQFWPNVKQERLRLSNEAHEIKASLALVKKQALEKI
jgi:hypothetical protein